MILVFFVSACNDKNELADELEKENDKLNERIFELESRIESSLCISYDSLYYYTSLLAVGAPSLKVGEKDTMATYLLLNDIPGGAKVLCTSENKADITLDYRSELNPFARYLVYSRDKKGTAEIKGDYTITLPDGSTKKIPWGRIVSIQ